MNGSGGIRTVLLALPVLLAAACADLAGAPVTPGADADAGPDDPIWDDVITCASTADCPVGHTCEGGLCQPMVDVTTHPECEADWDCPEGQVCDAAVGLCTSSIGAGPGPDDSNSEGITHPGQKLACIDGQSRICGVSKIGECRWGLEHCTSGGAWSGVCEGAVYPTNELCDYRDNDCDGRVDEDFDLLSDVLNCAWCGHACFFPHAAASCVAGGCLMGACEANWWNLDGKTDNGCEYPCTYTGAEECDGKDNDCDGSIDGIRRACYTGPAGTDGVGVCHGGEQTCTAGVWSACLGQKLPEAEECNGLDDDCDQMVDGIVESCYRGPSGTAGVGVCAPGSRLCLDGVWGECLGDVLPQAESCNAEDDDCDGVVDGLVRACYTGPAGTNGRGVCRGGTQTCTAGGYGACQNQILPSAETCNGLDDDCDGVTDGITQICYTGPPGTLGKGECRAGTSTCSMGAWGACVGDVTPKSESTLADCNNKDDDCDGVTDGFTISCYTGPAGTAGVGICKTGTYTCTAGALGACVGQVTPQPQDGPTGPTCDGIDNDCNGTVDDGCGCTNGATRPCYAGPAGTAGKGICRAGTQTCSGGAWGACVGQVLPAPESCDGLDNDCDGATDGLTQACYDGPAGTQGVGECKGGTSTCVMGAWGACQGQVVPGAETCDGKDNDCNGIADQISRPCYGGPAGTAGVGQCRAGTQICAGGAWGACAGEVLPSAEACDGLDNDCNGVVDGYSESCYTGPPGTQNKGECRGGSRTCTAGAWGACTGQVTPVPESCNNKDDDCDNAVDEELSQACYSGPNGTQGVGECKAGTQTCSAGTWGSCVGQVLPADESCNAKDDNCDGVVDGIVRSCYSGPSGTQGVGECKAGTETCSAGAWGACTGQVLPTVETCDNKDNDCDGVRDQVTRSCYTGPGATRGVGECKDGTQLCTSGVWSTTCTGQVTPVPESCNNKDDDCDGAVDESLTQACYTGPSGTLGVGECKAGSQTCAAGAWGVCTGQIVPTAEACDNLDNDCDGARDESLTRACYSGPAGTQGVGECRAGTQACASGTWGACSGEVTPAAEVCDIKNNDCDGLTDEGFDADGDGFTTCGGDCADNDPTRKPGAPEICNGLDDDCDGSIDEGLSAPTVNVGADQNVAPLSTATINATLTGCGGAPNYNGCTLTWAVQSQPSGASATLVPNKATATLSNLDTAGDYTVCLTATNSSSCAAVDCMVVRVVPIEKIHVELFFETSEIDMDLHYVAPGAGLSAKDLPHCYTSATKEKVVSFCNKTPNWGGNPAWTSNGITTDDPSLDKDVLRGPGTENLNQDNPFSGTYPVYVHYYCDCGNYAGPNCAQRVGAKNARVRIYVSGALRLELTRTLNYNQAWYVADITVSGTTVTVTSRNTTGNGYGGCFGP